MIRYIFISVMSFILSGCASFFVEGSKIKLTEAEKRERNMALIQSRNIDTSFLSKEPLAAFVDAVYPMQDDKVLPRIDFYIEKIGEVHLDPGQYLIVVKCQTGDTYAKPKKLMKIEPNKKYTLYCENEVTKEVLGIPIGNQAHAFIVETP